MPSTIKPSDIPVIAASGDGCSRFNALLRLPIQFKQFLEWLLTSTGEISDAAVQSMSDRLTPVGAIILWPAAQLPSSSWLVCNGQAIARTDYPILFSRIATIYGSGDGTTTFNLPDLQGRVARGVSTTEGLSVKTGADTVTLEVDNLPKHTHQIKIATINVDNEQTGTAGTVMSDNELTDTVSNTTKTTEETGAGKSFSIVPSNLALYYIIKAK